MRSLYKPVLFATMLSACGDNPTTNQPDPADYAGTWTLTPVAATLSAGECNNLNTNSGGLHFVLDNGTSLNVVTGDHDGGYGARDFRGVITGSLQPPNGGTLKFFRPGGSGTLTLTSVTPTRMEGTFMATDQSFDNDVQGGFCSFDAVAVKG
jgi:hypothetical protein